MATTNKNSQQQLEKSDLSFEHEVDKMKLAEVESDLETIKAEIPAIREEAQVFGMLKKIEFDQVSNQLLKYTALRRLKERKAHRKKFAMTWEQFCASIGESARNVDRIINDLRPLHEAVSDKMSDLPVLEGMNFNKIRWLCKSISDNLSEIEDGCLVVGDTRVPLLPENKDEIEALIENMKEAHQREKEEFKKKADAEKKRQARDKEAEIENLKIEKGSLVKRVKDLEAFVPDEKDDTWYLEQIQEIKDAGLVFGNLCRRFICAEKNEQLKNDRHLQCQIYSLIEEAGAELIDLKESIQEFLPFWE